jgi:hypothetical protein
MKKLTSTLAVMLLVLGCGDPTGPAPAPMDSEIQVEFSHDSERDFQCDGSFVGQTFEDVVVPPGKLCVLVESTVRGDIRVKKGAELFTRDNTVGGDIKADEALRVLLRDDHVEGIIKLERGMAGPGLFDHVVCGAFLPNGSIWVLRNRGAIMVGNPAVSCAGNTVEQGKIRVEDNRSVDPDELTVEGNTVLETVKVNENRGTGLKTVRANTAGLFVECVDNADPFVGGPNFAPRHKGECF